MRRAIELARASVAAGGGPFGAVVVRGDKVVGEGANRVVPDGDPTAHAEVVAIREAARELGSHVLAGCELYASCEPCPMCMAAISWARIERVAFACTREDAAAIGFDDDKLYRELALPPEEREVPGRALLRDEGLRAFADWRANDGRVAY